MADLPLGEPVEWSPVERPARGPLRGKHVLLRPVDAAADAESLYAESHPSGIWTYLPDGPYESAEHMRAALAEAERSEDPLFFTVVTDRPAGIAAYLRMAPEHGVIEIGHIWFGISIQRTAAATEAIHLLARHVFDDLGYRRLEWKCNALNAPSRRAAERFGFIFEGVFRKQQVVKGRNRDTACTRSSMTTGRASAPRSTRGSCLSTFSIRTTSRALAFDPHGPKEGYSEGVGYPSAHRVDPVAQTKSYRSAAARRARRPGSATSSGRRPQPASRGRIDLPDEKAASAADEAKTAATRAVTGVTKAATAAGTAAKEAGKAAATARVRRSRRQRRRRRAPGRGPLW